jgi:AraC family transcriptional regulator
MFLRIENIAPKIMAGASMSMTLGDNRTPELWKSFMPFRNQIQHRRGEDLFNIQRYENFDYDNLSLQTRVTKFAAVEVTRKDHLPGGLHYFVLSGGSYAVFLYKGIPAAFQEFFDRVYHEWLPSSGHELDDREHFEVLGERYKRDDPDSEEEIWIPVRPKNKGTD